MTRALVNRCIAASACTLTFAVAATPAAAQTYKVEVTNLTKGQILAPVVVATHNLTCPPMFEIGKPATDEIAKLAEDAVNQPLIDKLNGYACVKDVKVILGAGGPIMPGETASVDIGFQFNQRWVSLAGMLVTTNDAFIGLLAAQGPQVRTRTDFVVAYDAGSEANTEDCAHIPGPPCGNAGFRVVDGAEGYIHVHNGVHGISDMLTSAAYDWHNPAAMVRITRNRSN